MNPLFQVLIHQSVAHGSDKKNPVDYEPNHKEIYHFKKQIRRQITNGLFILLGVLIAGFGLESFLLPNGFIDGGVTGISLLVSEITGWPLALLIVIINIPFIYLGYKTIDKSFGIKTSIAISALALCIVFVPFPVITSDKLLVAIFGGAFLGAGIGLAMRGGCVIDGTEVFALTVSRKSNVSMGNIVLAINLVIFSVAAFILSIETSLYSILTYFAASKTLDFIVSGIDEHTGVTIVSNYSESIRKMVTEKLGRGVTIYQGKRGYGNRGHKLNETDIIFTVTTRLEVSELIKEVERIDSRAFIIMNSITGIKGGRVKRKPLH